LTVPARQTIRCGGIIMIPSAVPCPAVKTICHHFIAKCVCVGGGSLCKYDRSVMYKQSK